jgi:hypothetical protein
MVIQDFIYFIRTECENIEATINEVIILNNTLANKTPSNIEIAAISFFLSSVYSGYENIFKRLCRFNNIFLPKSDSYHINLLNFFYNSKYPKLPVLLTENTINHFRELCQFRFIVRKGYISQLEWEKIIPLIREIEFSYREFKSNLDNYINPMILKTNDPENSV